MRNLLNFILHYISWFVFVFYVLLSLALISTNSAYRQSIYLTSANAVSSTVNGAAAGVTGYFALHDINASLEKRTSDLEAENLNLREQIKSLRAIVEDTLGKTQQPYQQRYKYILAPVITSTVGSPRNYIVISKGYNDGVKPGMGVVAHNGVVGVVNVSGPHTSRVISVLNEAQFISVKIKDTPFVGTLSWHGLDPKTAYVQELPRHARYHIGDTIVTTGFSTAFPAGIPVGTVQAQVRGDDDNYFTLKVRLAPDFGNLRAVRVVSDIYRAELDTLSHYDLK